MSQGDHLKFRLTLLDITTLLYNVYRGAQTPEIGFEDCDLSMKDMVRDFGGRTTKAHIPRRTLESALWSCSQMNDNGQFWSPTGETFKQLIERIEQTAIDGAAVKFDERYNLLTEKGNSET